MTNNSQATHNKTRQILNQITNDSPTVPKQSQNKSPPQMHTNSQDVRMAALDQRAAEAWLHLNPDPQVPLPASELRGESED